MVWSILKRNLNVMYNSKLSFLILIFGPLFLMLIVGGVLQNNSLGQLDAVFYVGEMRSVDSDVFIENLKLGFEGNNITVNEVDSLEKCKDEVLNSRADVCIELLEHDVPKNLDNFVENVVNYEVRTHVDFSKSRTVWDVIERVRVVVNYQSEHFIDSAVLDVKENLGRIFDDLESEMFQVNSIVNSFIEMESMIDSLRADANTYNKNLEALNNQFNSLNEKAVYILATIKFIEPAATAKAEDFAKTLNDMNQTIHDLKTSSVAALPANLDTLQTKINSARTRLAAIRTDLNRLKSEWDLVSKNEIDELSDPVKYSYLPVSKKDVDAVDWALDFFDYLFPSILMFFLIFVSIIFSTVIVIKERKSSSHVRNMVGNFSAFKLIFGNFLSILIVLIFQMALIVCVSSFFLNLAIFSNVFILSFFLIISCSLFVCVGVLIGFIFNSEEGAIIASVSVALLFLIFLPIISPAGILPGFFSTLISYMPFVILESKIRLALIFGVIPSFSFLEILSLVCCFVLNVFLIAVFYVVNKRKEI